MTSLNSVLQSAKVAVIAVSLIVSCSTFANAHSVDACIDDVWDFCGSDSACRTSGSKACFSHGHPGGSVPPAPDPDDTKATDLGWQLNRSQQLSL